MHVGIRQVSKRFGATAVLNKVSFEVADREFFFLLGPSGCGKTTMLRLIAGFHQPDDGELRFGDRVMNGIEPHRRNTGMVFQNYALWPHLTVAENVAYGLDVRSVPSREKQARIAEALRIVRMENYGARTPNQLSGGQQQRVALARALVIRPDVLLLDEPLSNLDAQLRLEMRDEIRRIHDETRVTTIYVTHDQKEALSMADRLAVMRDGVIDQIGPPREVYRHPANRFVAEFIGEVNWLRGTVRGMNGSSVEIETPAGMLGVDQPSDQNQNQNQNLNLRAGLEVDVGFRPESVRLESAARNSFAATLEKVTYLGEIEQYLLRLGDGSLVKAFEQDPEVPRAAGEHVDFHVPPAAMFLLARG